MQPPQPILVSELFPVLLNELVSLLKGLSKAEWGLPTACSSWSVKDVALHLLGGDIGILSWRRDGHSIFASINSWDHLVSLVNEQNEQWVKSAQRISPELIMGLLKYTGEQVTDYFQSLDPFVMGGAVAWVSPDPAPAWLDLAREYTERWHHQQHIRDAVGKPGLKEEKFLAPILDTFILALPRTFKNEQAESGTSIGIAITGSVSKHWTLNNDLGDWRLYEGSGGDDQATVVIEDDVAWRIFTNEISAADAKKLVQINGAPQLGEIVLNTVSIIA
ncbi:MAG: maleylpyruvate isomerase family mycothiol-dependent enzyme [Anaerolineales bacterium]